ncbi:MAG: hypothetical protein OXG69_11750 [bacterium]|nr:hypothetical protein [bacterium]
MRIAERGAIVSPGCDGRDFLVGQAAVILQWQVRPRWHPGRHKSIHDMKPDITRRPDDIFRGGEGGISGDLTVGMTGEAVGFDYRARVLMIGGILRHADGADVDRFRIVVIVRFIAMRQDNQRAKVQE